MSAQHRGLFSQQGLQHFIQMSKLMALSGQWNPSTYTVSNKSSIRRH